VTAATVRRVALAALVVRLGYLAEHSASPFFTVPVLDAFHFDRLARGFADGSAPPELLSGFRGILYPLLLAPLYVLFDRAAPVAVQILQHLLGVATAVGVAALAGRLFARESAALAAGLLYALAAPPLFHEGQLLAESFFVALLCATMLLFVDAEHAAGERPEVRFATAGLLLALATQLRPTALLLALAIPARALSARPARRGLLVAGATFVIALPLLALAQAPWLGRFQLLPTSGGVNLYLGNHRGADGLLPRQTERVSYGEPYRDSIEVWAETSARADGEPFSPLPSGGSRYWLRRTLDELRGDPLGRAQLLARKGLVLLWNGEVPNNRSFAFAAAEESRWLRWLPVRFGLLLALAAVGLAAGRADAPRFWILACTLLHAAGVVLFFVADRFRVPLFLPAAALAGGGLVTLLDAWLRREPARWRCSVLAAAAALLAFPDWTGAGGRLPGPARDLHFRSIAHLERGELDAALADARRASALESDDPHFRTQLGLAALAAGQLDEAESALRGALRIAPHEPRTLNALGALADRRGERERAVALYRQAFAAAPTFAPARLNLAWSLLVAGDTDAAAQLLAGWSPATPASAQLLLARAEIARTQGHPEDAERLRAAAFELAPEATAGLLRELSRVQRDLK
jgi:Flp pilus assembly protein TadD